MDSKRNVPTGILGFPVSPFNEKDKLDEKALYENVSFLIRHGIESIFIGCGAGEFHAISEDEYETMIDVANEATQSQVPIYTGVGGNIRTAVRQAELSEKKGVDGYLILPPYLVEGTRQGDVEYFSRIAQSTQLNAIVYQRNNVLLTKESLYQLVTIPQVVGFKDGVGNMEQNIQLTQAVGDRLEWINGMPMAEVTMPAYMALGFETFSSAISNYIPHVSRMFYDSLLHDDKQMAADIYRDVILPINNIRKQRSGYAVALIKAGMEIVGLPVRNTVRPPLTPVEPVHYKELEAVINVAFDKYALQTK
ncbi:5-dehydro-4-deoxyglucarate dehydratase [Salibacterium halotolerans]|uniref:Probable 5-dehydro-4-deoxyglucarate dehydratase n=1 Tax=Salibacterium halotolerans TaxID=1884432 RepID=A0A1I5SXS7_9BACI|nr:5-dehydro-4-deoxyglucarate dehydratase [Salibacterium halotolerans]SFP75553.1 5-dehydro-4-deoxyglucarate dehydratase [Salibacterium halotolerans]